MPDRVGSSLRLQAEECLRVAKETSDPVVRMELLSAAAWLHDKEARIEQAVSKIVPRAADKAAAED